MSKFIFIWWLLKGTITPAGEYNGVKVYTIWYEDGKVIDYATKQEIISEIDSTMTDEIDEEEFFKYN